MATPEVEPSIQADGNYRIKTRSRILLLLSTISVCGTNVSAHIGRNSARLLAPRSKELRYHRIPLETLVRMDGVGESLMCSLRQVGVERITISIKLWSDALHRPNRVLSECSIVCPCPSGFQSHSLVAEGPGVDPRACAARGGGKALGDCHCI